MAKIIFDTTKGYIVGSFANSQTLPSMPTGYATFSPVGDPIEFIDKQVDISGPTIIERDYLVFTGLDDQDVSTVATHGVQKYNGETDLLTALTSDDEVLIFQIGDTTSTPQSDQGFLEDTDDQLVLGAATSRLASGAIVGPEFLHVRAGFLGVFSKEITYK